MSRGSDERELPRPEDLDEAEWEALLDRVEEGATRRHLEERKRLIAEGMLDAEGRVVRKTLVAPGPSSRGARLKKGARTKATPGAMSVEMSGERTKAGRGDDDEGGW